MIFLQINFLYLNHLFYLILPLMILIFQVDVCLNHHYRMALLYLNTFILNQLYNVLKHALILSEQLQILQIYLELSFTIKHLLYFLINLYTLHIYKIFTLLRIYSYNSNSFDFSNLHCPLNRFFHRFTKLVDRDHSFFVLIL